MIIDTHMHIFDKRYDGVRDEVIKKALDANVMKMIAVGYDYQSSLKALNLAHTHAHIYCAIGLHPSEAALNHNLDWIALLAKNEKVVAIGEIGLDYYRDKTHIEIQKEIFIKQMEIANNLKLPVIIHCRDAINDCLKIMSASDNCGVMHCFSSSLEMAKEVIKLGYYIGVGGVVTFKNNRELKRVVEGIDLEYILSETDSPYLAPDPYRGQMNQPAYTVYVVDEIANIKNVSSSEVIRQLVINTQKLFGI